MVKIAYVFGNGDEAIVVLENDDVYSIGIVQCGDVLNPSSALVCYKSDAYSLHHVHHLHSSLVTYLTQPLSMLWAKSLVSMLRALIFVGVICDDRCLAGDTVKLLSGIARILRWINNLQE